MTPATISELFGVSEDVIAQLHAGAMQPTLQRTHRDTESRGGLGRAELLDVT
jgi:hypothetical protein